MAKKAKYNLERKFKVLVLDALRVLLTAVVLNYTDREQVSRLCDGISRLSHEINRNDQET